MVKFEFTRIFLYLFEVVKFNDISQMLCTYCLVRNNRLEFFNNNDLHFHFIINTFLTVDLKTRHYNYKLPCCCSRKHEVEWGKLLVADRLGFLNNNDLHFHFIINTFLTVDLKTRHYNYKLPCCSRKHEVE